MFHKDILNQIYSFLDGYKRADLNCKISVKLKKKFIQINKLKISYIYTGNKITYFINPEYNDFSVGYIMKYVNDKITYQWIKIINT
jgi:hypothetical protein